MTGVYPQVFPRLQIADDQLPGEFEPRDSLPANLLQKESITAKDSCAQRLLKRDDSTRLMSPPHDVMLEGSRSPSAPNGSLPVCTI